eukprot:6335228-Ditylum_brightwellii.AAC.1
MDTSNTLTISLLRSTLPSDTKILRTQPAFKVKLQEEANMYALHTCTAANSASQIEGIPADQCCLQNIGAFQSSKDASRKWYRELDCIFENEL